MQQASLPIGQHARQEYLIGGHPGQRFQASSFKSRSVRMIDITVRVFCIPLHSQKLPQT